MSDAVESVTDEAVVVEPTEPEAVVEPAPVEPEGEPEAGSVESAESDPNEGLKKALASERAINKENAKKLAALEKRLAERGSSEGEAEAAQVVVSALNKRLVAAEVKAALAGRVESPARVLSLVDLEAVQVSDDGEVDSDSVSTVVEGFLERFPEFAAGESQRFSGSADQGAKGRDAKPAQLSKDDLSKLSPSEILKAYNDGRLSGLTGSTK